MIADHGPVLPENWGCWLPIWLPELARLSVVRMTENSIGCAAADGVLLVCSAPNLTCSRHRRRPRKRAASPRRALAASMTPGPGARMQVVRRGADASDLALSVRHHVHSGIEGACGIPDYFRQSVPSTLTTCAGHRATCWRPPSAR
jgi:hypothetical protein